MRDTVSPSFLGLEYMVDDLSSLIEFTLENIFWPELKQITWLSTTGMLMVVFGECLRKVAMFTAGSNFNHRTLKDGEITEDFKFFQPVNGNQIFSFLDWKVPVSSEVKGLQRLKPFCEVPKGRVPVSTIHIRVLGRLTAICEVSGRRNSSQRFLLPGLCLGEHKYLLKYHLVKVMKWKIRYVGGLKYFHLLVTPSKTFSSLGCPGLHKPCPIINPSSTRVPLLALHAQAEKASLQSANHCQGGQQVDVAP
ncbi:hypothetical protein U0070_020821 [Myodes glareolus]|uniref:Uncharacterized protein n=1 Tax=Myodes glareolus TaxID=447135 RepID=A0AAW0HDY5_MYOGA